MAHTRKVRRCAPKFAEVCNGVPVAAQRRARRGGTFGFLLLSLINLLSPLSHVDVCQYICDTGTRRSRYGKLRLFGEGRQILSGNEGRMSQCHNSAKRDILRHLAGYCVPAMPPGDGSTAHRIRTRRKLVKLARSAPAWSAPRPVLKSRAATVIHAPIPGSLNVTSR